MPNIRAKNILPGLFLPRSRVDRSPESYGEQSMADDKIISATALDRRLEIGSLPAVWDRRRCIIDQEIEWEEDRIDKTEPHAKLAYHRDYFD